jgi:DNA-binding response OmpR family regulator
MAYLLIVDDDEGFASAAATVLQGEGHEVQTALTPELGLESMKARRPDLAILDVMFPESSVAGFELARQIQRSEEGLRGMPVLMLTAVNARFPLGFSRNDIDEDWLPVSDFLEKPVSFDALRAKVAEMLAQAGAGAAAETSEE